MNILITGAAARIGAELVKELFEKKNHMLIHFNSSIHNAHNLAAYIRESGGTCTLIQADLSTEAGCLQLLEGVFAAVDTVDVLVNNAAEFSYDQPQEFDYKKLERAIRVNLIAPAFLMKEISNRLATPANALFVNILDQKVSNLNPDYFSYTLAKCGLAAASELYAMSLAEKGIRVVGISPGVTLPSGPQTESEFVDATRCTPLGVSSTPADIASAIRFAINCRSLTGTNLVVDGGESLIRRERDIAFWKRDRR
jgi:NAD(P)-dependent dehydrogenase (short-subunit alcohol dehydrogenase family)